MRLSALKLPVLLALLAFVLPVFAPITANALDGKFQLGARGGLSKVNDNADENRDDWSYIAMVHGGMDFHLLSGSIPTPIDVFLGVEGWYGMSDTEYTPKLLRNVKVSASSRYGANARVGIATAVNKFYALAGYVWTETDITTDPTFRQVLKKQDFEQTGVQLGVGATFKLMPFMRLNLEGRYTKLEGDIETKTVFHQDNDDIYAKYRVEDEIYDVMLGIGFEF